MATKAPKQHDPALGESSEEPETDDGLARAGKTRAQPERRCIVTGERGAPADMVRFVLSPDGAVTPDIALRLPGRGAWVRADRAVVDKAVASGAFSRAFRSQAQADPELSDQVAALVAGRVLHHLGLGRRAGDVLCGFEIVRDALKSEGCACLIEASDGADDGREKLVQILRARQAGRPETANWPNPGESCLSPALAGCFTAEELGMALGRERVVHACVRAGRFADVWLTDLARLSGFAPVWPPEWPGLADVAKAGRGDQRSDGGSAAPDGISPRGEE